MTADFAIYKIFMKGALWGTKEIYFNQFIIVLASIFGT